MLFFLFVFKVPDVLFTTIDLPSEAAVTGKGCLIQARYKTSQLNGSTSF